MMDKSEVIRAFEKIARKEGVSVDEVRREIQKAIDDAMQSDDPAVQSYWKKIKYKADPRGSRAVYSKAGQSILKQTEDVTSLPALWLYKGCMQSLL